MKTTTMNIYKIINNIALTLVFFAASTNLQAANTDLAESPLVTSSDSEVLPNVFFILDDSGSMDWAYMPDWANSNDQAVFRNSDYNGVAYNPAITYTPPTAYKADGTLDTDLYPSQTGMTTETGASSAAKPNWRAVKVDQYGVQSTSTSNLEGNAYFYTFVAGEYCTEPKLRTCIVSSTATTTHTYPAKLRWCKTSANAKALPKPADGDCQAVRIEEGSTQYENARYAGLLVTPAQSATATLTFTSASSGSTVTGITIGGVQIMSGAASAGSSGSASTRRNTLASNVAAKITLAGYSATSSNGDVTITAPASLGNITFDSDANLSKTGTVAVSGNNFSGGVTEATVPGTNIRTDIVSGNSYPYPNTAVKASTRTDCAGNRCTYYEEMTNYANWWTYYHTRMQMMKTATSIAFQPISNSYRVGYMSINVNNGDYVPIKQFTAANKKSWYGQLFAANPVNGTPLRAALTAAGRYYAGKKISYTSPASNKSVSMNDDPMQYSCQQNFTILSTDGYWNAGDGKTIDGSVIGNEDASEGRPMNDGGTVTSNSTATIRINTSSSTKKITGIKVNNVQIMSGAADGTNTESTFASRVAAMITLAGYQATSDGQDITIVAPSSLGAITYTPVITTSGSSGTLSTTIHAFTGTLIPITNGGTSNTLADVAQYYYATDLRSSALSNCTGAVISPAIVGNDVCTDNVPKADQDAAATQHMTTFTLGLGASGQMQYLPTYATATAGDFSDVKKGTDADPSSGICSWQSSDKCNWPIPVADEQTAIDDLWHAGVNGRGAYFSATNPASLAASLNGALSGVSARAGSSAAATTSNPNITSGDNFIFSSTFTTLNWDGELVRQQLDLTTGKTSDGIDWAAQALLDTNITRKIYTYDSSDADDHLQEFTVANFGANPNFTKPNISGLSQFCTTGITCLSAANQTAASGNNLVRFLRGERTNEGVATDTASYYRLRTHVLGDIVNAEAVYVKAPLYNYSDFGYKAFVLDPDQKDRKGMVYVAANDGMLHAFNAADDTGIVGGNEAWAYIPSMVMPNLYKLADKNYANLHQFYVDGTPVVGDICLSTSDCGIAATADAWRTILVGGLNLGGRGYYALDITDPAAPKAMWEFTDDNMGYTFGNPKIAKLSDGTWVVLITSGYNNVAPGDGQGYLYVINATTGALIRKIGTGVGSTSTITGVCTVAPCPSGLAKIAARVVNPSSDNTVEAVYGGDMFGNLWRFDVNNTVGATGYDAQLLAVLKGPSDNLQPITAKPEVGTVSGNKAVFLGTGSYLGNSDLGDVKQQSLYAIKDPLTPNTNPSVAIYNNPRSPGAGFVQQTQTNSICPVGAPVTICSTGQVVRTSSNNVVNFATDNGWFIDLPDGVGSTNGSGSERANTDPALALGTLGFTTNVPNSNACTIGGYSYRYFLDYRTGAPVSTSTGNIVATRLGNALATRPVYVRLPNNTVVELTRLSDGTTVTSDVPIGSGAGATRRTSWRELISE